ncbi:MgtC/SapB family protein [Streptomyces sp. SL13]|uniref:MgtC/SapB family protein n=1 Tax=Streptantibioticus silvisoli TaxID=2705255 RepID=A0AA90GX58_9ACTN|nr:MgtC/SapB family protein [Streptantibioticus silvisoli]MDI5961463.1 MgtC/SapB family protein [Streptantibioticus silvisoli]MDI5968046.1 MgtC/SapB family protein [Streptantibioticus silvisoli]
MREIALPLWDPAAGQGFRQLAELGLALVLSTVIGVERAVQQKSAGLRTHTLVGVGSALFMEVSQHGFNSVLALQHISFDPSRVAAQIVSGIGFIGGGIIFVRRDAVRGLTTAATVWLTCAIGMACGGGLPLLALAATATHFLVVRGYPLLTRLVPAISTAAQAQIQVAYDIGGGVLPRVLERCTRAGFRVLDVRVERAPWLERDEEPRPADPGTSDVELTIQGTGSVHQLVAELAELEGIRSVWSPAVDTTD